MHEKHKKQYYTKHLQYLQNRYKRLERQLQNAYDADDTRAINFLEVELRDALDELMDAKADYIKNK